MNFDDFAEIVSSVILRDTGKLIEDLLVDASGGLALAAKQLAFSRGALVALIAGAPKTQGLGSSTAIDGPTGAATLATTLESVGVSVILLTTDYNLQAVEAAVNGLGVGLSNPVRTIATAHGTDFNTECEFLSLELTEAGLSHVIEIGQSAIVDQDIPGIFKFQSLSDVFPRGRLAKLSNAHFIEIIDDFRRQPTDSRRESRHTSQVMPDALVLSATSNWGAYALAVAVRLLNPSQEGLRFEALELDSQLLSLRFLMDLRARDDAPSVSEALVDGIQWNEYGQVLVAISAVAEATSLT